GMSWGSSASTRSRAYAVNLAGRRYQAAPPKARSSPTPTVSASSQRWRKPLSRLAALSGDEKRGAGRGAGPGPCQDPAGTRAVSLLSPCHDWGRRAGGPAGGFPGVGVMVVSFRLRGSTGGRFQDEELAQHHQLEAEQAQGHGGHHPAGDV